MPDINIEHKSSNKVVKYYLYVLCFSYVFSMQPWFFYGTLKSYVYDFITMFLLLPLIGNRKIFKLSLNRHDKKILTLFVFSFFIYGATQSLNAILSYVPVVLIIFYLLKTRDEIKCLAIRYITVCVAVIVGVSLLFHIYYLLSPYSLPIFLPSDGSYDKGFYNQYVNIISSWMPYTRFQSVFIEPGHLTMGVFPLLFLNRFNFKSGYVLILLSGLLFSLSLAGYIYIVISLLYFSINQRTLLKTFIGISLISAIIWHAFKYGIAHGDSDFAKAIIERLEITDNNIAGDNRVTEQVEKVYKKIILSDDALLGTSKYDNLLRQDGNNGYKVIVIRNGILVLLLMFLSYLNVARSWRDRKIIFWLGLLVLMMSQNYYPHWPAMLISAIMGTTYIERHHKA